MMINSDEFRALPQKKTKLKDCATLINAYCSSKEEYKELLETQVKKLSSLQQLHYASNRHALLLIFQGMDAAGKDGAIRHVMSGVNPQGCQVSSFKQPSAEELEHDFLWRAAKHLPERGHIGIFNRSYYEDVLIVRVHPEMLQGKQEPDVWQHRYRSITDLEKHLYCNGTQVIKIFLHLSEEEQRKRFLERIDDPDKNWKLSVSDLSERKFWEQYMDAYEECLNSTSAKHAPWYVVPADDKDNARLIVSQIVVDAFQKLKMAYPEVSAQQKQELENIRKLLQTSRVKRTK